MNINGREIGKDKEVFVIAEVGINHNGDFETAKKLINEAITAGCDAVKLQTYLTEKRVPKDSPIFDILKKCELSFSDQKKLFEYAKDKGIEIFSTPFDDESVDFLEETGSSCYKIASFDIVNKKLLEKIAQTKKPVIISRGMANQEEIDAAIDIFKKAGSEYAILHCVSAYPVESIDSLNLNTIRALENRYTCAVGFSDHTIGIDASKYAVSSGASIIEKHFTLSKEADGPDHALSTEPKDMKEMIAGIRAVSRMMGKPSLGTYRSRRGDSSV